LAIQILRDLRGLRVHVVHPPDNERTKLVEHLLDRCLASLDRKLTRAERARLARLRCKLFGLGITNANHGGLLRMSGRAPVVTNGPIS